MAQPDLQRTVTRNTNDITALYELGTEIKQTVEVTNERVGGLEHRVGKLEHTVHGLSQKVHGVEKRLESQDRRLTAVISVQQRHGRQLSELQLSVDRLTELHNQHSDRLDKLTDRTDKLTVRMDELTVRMDELTVRMDEINDRMGKLTDDMTARVDRIENKLETGLASLGAQLAEVLTVVRGGAASEKT